MSVSEWAKRVADEVETVIRGKRETILRLLTALLADGHVLLEDVPGVGKTILARSLAAALGVSFSRIQCTPDLLPADVLGLSVYNPSDGSLEFREGPIVSNVVLVDEINRATPRTQSALLEAMGEGQVTVEGRCIELPTPFFLVATENPIEFEGTFPLPEAQRDRFLLTTEVGYPDRRTEKGLLFELARLEHPVTKVRAVSTADEVVAVRGVCAEVFLSDDCAEYLLAIVEGTRSEATFSLGASTRASIALARAARVRAAINDRDFVVPEDVRDLAVPVLWKRVAPTPDAVVRNLDTKQTLGSIVQRTRVPVLSEESP